jgi:hypothetical protein
MTHTLRNPPRHVRDRDRGRGGGGREGERERKEDRKGKLITENYKNVHSGQTAVFRGRNPINKTLR